MANYKDRLQILMGLVDDQKELMGDETYRLIANDLKSLHDQSQVMRPRNTRDAIGSYWVVSPDLFHILSINSYTMDKEYGEDFDLCVRFDGLYETLPNGHTIRDSEPMTRFARDHGEDYYTRHASGPFYKFTPNLNFEWIAQRQHGGDIIMPILWLEKWMLNLLDPIGPGGFYNRVVTFPLCHGWAHPTFLPMRQGWTDPSLFNRFQEHDTEDEWAQDMLIHLPSDHPLRWVGWWRGMRYGFNWKQLRDHMRTRAITSWWMRIALKKRKSASS